MGFLEILKIYSIVMIVSIFSEGMPMGMFHQGDVPQVTKTASSPHHLPTISMLAGEPESFGYKIAWLAVRTDDPEKVLSVLADVRDIQRANWQSGIAWAYRAGATGGDNFVFVSPPVNGWVFVVGVPYLEKPEFNRPIERILQLLLPVFPEVQYFGSDRRVGYVAWAKIHNGQWLRRFAVADGTVFFNDGAFTEEERQLGLVELQDCDFGDNFEEWLESGADDEETVLRLAGLWSINPEDLPEMGLPPSVGWLVRNLY